ncbi:MAG: flavodoxin-dependent (E)-4-hydroxy-3-methylbut-2-enyl-diphosphate synthase [Endomicrobiaceae bacterium]|nr:flavodoxin-dependent (E)-4-hydroxy-3-methylbut-2-enyl-diphosphate synthase [Endomicrobiaceae bacterium]
MKIFTRENTKIINIGGVKIGGGNPIRVQSMTNTDTRDWKATVKQIKELEQYGCEIIRVSVPDMESAQNIKNIKKNISIPLVADIHFDHRIAIESIKQGIDKLRINPGNIGSKEKVQELVKEAKKAKIPIRIGVNAGSLKFVHEFHTPLDKAKALVKSAMEHVEILEDCNFYDIAVSLKASDVITTVEAHKIFAQKRNYPLHLGITESGSIFRGTIKSSSGLAIMLYMGLGDTIRVSLTTNPIEQVKVAYQILQSLNLRSTGVEIISCPTCARCKVDLINIVNQLEAELAKIKKTNKKEIKIAVMGCAVNGPGEAKDADFGIAGGQGEGILFQKGEIIGKIPQNLWVKKLISLYKNI